MAIEGPAGISVSTSRALFGRGATDARIVPKTSAVPRQLQLRKSVSVDVASSYRAPSTAARIMGGGGGGGAPRPAQAPPQPAQTMPAEVVVPTAVGVSPQLAPVRAFGGGGGASRPVASPALTQAAPVVVDAPTAATLGASVTVPDWVLIVGGVVIVGGLGWFLRKRGIL